MAILKPIIPGKYSEKHKKQQPIENQNDTKTDISAKWSPFSLLVSYAADDSLERKCNGENRNGKGMPDTMLSKAKSKFQQYAVFQGSGWVYYSSLSLNPSFTT